MNRVIRTLGWLNLLMILTGINLFGQAPAVQIKRDIVYAFVDGVDLKLDIYSTDSEEPLPAIILLHTTSTTKTDAELIVPWANYLASQGYAAVAVEHRKYPFSNGPDFPAQLHDIKCAVRFLRSNANSMNITPEFIGVLGFSSGGWLAALMGTTGDSEGLEGTCGDSSISSQVQAVVTYYSVSDFFQMPRIGQFDVGDVLIGKPCLPGPSQATELCTQASPITHISADDAPFLVVHGTADTNIPFAQSELMQAALEAADVEAELVRVEGAGHIWRINTTFEAQVQERLIPFLKAYLKPE